jgi:mono/diheme cytochrome c family protein
MLGLLKVGLILILLVGAVGCTAEVTGKPNSVIPDVTVASTLTVPNPSAVKPVASTVSGVTNGSAGDPVKTGEGLYQKTAGGIGCAGCHGTDATGKVGPNIRGSSSAQIKTALQTVTAMSFLKLADSDIDAVSAYLNSLGAK